MRDREEDRTEDRGRRTEGRGRMTDDGPQRTGILSVRFGCGPGRGRHETPKTRDAAVASRAPACSDETKPASTTVPIGRSAFPGASMRNKADWKRSFKGQVSSVKQENPSFHYSTAPGFQSHVFMRNKANFHRTRYPSLPLFHHSSIPTQCPACETKPIGAAGDSRCGVFRLDLEAHA